MNIRKQQGFSLIRFLIMLGLMLFVVLLGMRIAPLYLEYYSVVKILDGVAAEQGAARFSHDDLRMKVLDRLYLNYSTNVRASDIQIYRRNGVFLRIAYEVRQPLIGNLDVVAHFDKSVRLSD